MALQNPYGHAQASHDTLKIAYEVSEEDAMILVRERDRIELARMREEGELKTAGPGPLSAYWRGDEADLLLL